MLAGFLLLTSVLVTPIPESQMKQAVGQSVQGKDTPAVPYLIPPETAGGLSRDSKDQQVVLLGATTREAILAHREIFRDNTQHREIKAAWTDRWKAIDIPCTLVVVFGSWCSDSQVELPDLLALTKEANPFVTLQYVGVYRDKKVEAGAWPKGITPQVIEKVPTIWLFELQPGGEQKLLGQIVETAPNGQRMAEAVLELLEKAK